MRRLVQCRGAVIRPSFHGAASVAASSRCVATASLPGSANVDWDSVEEGLAAVRLAGTRTGLNVVAFSGGVDSSLVAKLVQMEFPTNSFACIGLSAALPKSQLKLAREVAAIVGADLREVATKEGDTPEYVANAGNSCFYCKTELYSTLQAVADELMGESPESEVVMFNGTNADDRQDPTRLGLVAADNFRVASPLSTLTKDQVRDASRRLGLPNWNHAASPCLRSRLALNVEATERHLAAVEISEELVRATLSLTDSDNLRVRMLAGRRAAIEVDAHNLSEATAAVPGLFPELTNAGLSVIDVDGLLVREFKSGNVSGLQDKTQVYFDREKEQKRGLVV